MEIRPGIHQIPGLKWSNAFLLVEDSGLTLINGGLPGDGSKVLNYISRLGHAPQDLQRIILTHSHPDHSAPMKELSRLSGASITIHLSDTRYRVKTGERWLHYPGQPPAFDWKLHFFRRITVHETIEDRQVLPVMGGLQMLHTPVAFTSICPNTGYCSPETCCWSTGAASDAQSISAEPT